MNFQDLRAFLHVAERGSYTDAASVLGVPKSTVSRRVARLEESLGARLLYRTTRSVRLSDTGRAVHERARGALLDLESIARLVGHAEPDLRGTLRVTAPLDLVKAFLGCAIAEFSRVHPGVEIDLMVTNRAVDLLEEGVDLALRAGRAPSDPVLATRELWQYDVRLFASPEYLERYSKPEHPEDLEEHIMIGYGGPARADRWRLAPIESESRASVPCSVNVEQRISADDLSAVSAAACAGCGIAPLPAFPWADEIANGLLIPVLPAWRVTHGSVWLAWPASRHLAPRLRAFADHLVAQASGIGGSNGVPS